MRALNSPGDTAPRYQVRAEALLAKPRVAEAVGHFRLAFRDIARSNDERSMIAIELGFRVAIRIKRSAGCISTPVKNRKARFVPRL